MSQQRPDVQSVVDPDAYEVEKTHSVEIVDGVDWAAACRFCRTSFDTKRDEARHLCAGRAHTDYQADGRPAVIEPGAHEIQAQLTFPWDNMGNYFAIVSQFDEAYQGRVETFEFDGDTWEFVLEEHRENEDEDRGATRPWQGGIASRPQDDFERFNEYQIVVRQQEDDGPDRREAQFQFRPSLPDATHYESGEPIRSLPDDLPEGVRVQTKTVNVDLEEILPLLRQAVSAIDISRAYFADDNVDSGTIYSMAMYVRLYRDAIDGLVDADGTVERIARFSSRAATKGEWKWDNREIESHHQSVVVCDQGWAKLIDGQEYAKRVKPYHPEHPRKSETDDDALSSPKVEVQFVNDIADNHAVPWVDRHRLQREIDEALVNVLHWSDLPLGADASVYREDAYWSASTSQRDIAIFDDPTEELRAAEEDVAAAQFRANGWGQKEALAALQVADHGATHYQELAEEIDASVSTVYRAISKASDVLTSDNGYVQFADRVIKQKMQQLSKSFRTLAQAAGAQVEELVDQSKAVEYVDSAFGAWMQRYGVAPGPGTDGLELDLSDVERGWMTVRKLLREGYQAAVASNVVEIARATIHWRDHAGDLHSDPIGAFIDDYEMQDLRLAVATP